jgi:hypothetical protein
MKAKSHAMTLHEANLIEENLLSGSLDPDLPGTAEVLNEARRVRFDAQLWGVPKTDPARKQVRRAVAFAVLCVIAMIGALSLPFLTSI